MAAASCGEAMTPAQPAASARRARRVTASSTPSAMPSAARSAASSEVSTVTASTLVAPAPATAASSILRPPPACTVNSSTPIFDGDLGGAAHRLGDVVELEIEKDALVALVQRVDQLAPLGEVELEPDLVALDGVAERVDLLERGARVRVIERDDEPLPPASRRRLRARGAPARRRSVSSAPWSPPFRRVS